MELPILLILTNNNQENDSQTVSSLDLIQNIRKISNEENINQYDGKNLHIHNIKTKYYSTNIALLPCESIDELSDHIVSKIEGVLITFNPKDRKFLEKLPQYVEFIKSRGIEFSIVLCDELLDDVKNGITFKCIKDCYNLLDIIELGSKNNEDDDDEEEDLYNPSGYEELNQALKSVIWSSVNKNVDPIAYLQLADGNDEKENEDSEGIDENDIDNEFERFENLLSQVMQFRPNTTNMSRDERLDCAQNFAEVFEKLIMQDDENESKELPN